MHGATVKLVVIGILVIGTAPESCRGSTTDPPRTSADGCFQEVAIEGVRFGSAAPRVRVQVYQTCTTPDVIATQLTRVQVSYKASRFGGEWLKAGYEQFHEPPGREHVYSYALSPCKSGRYRVEVAQAGTFDTGKEFRATDEQTTSVNCEDARDIA
ncbi:hypothetical protein ACIBEJ_15395 [Nonomuraea sp. NPDC050790]|uniref:hypothetical protein n=1 Tax=Nonomuraea sp. NPDC050790 TaxID=3364371 RepID=UPI00379A1C97